LSWSTALASGLLERFVFVRAEQQRDLLDVCSHIP
jgi:hypothetical protein